MTLIKIKNDSELISKNAFLNYGFRIFFLAGSFFSIISIFTWMIFYVFHFSPVSINISITSWHAHEMIYGFCIAIVAGFLLTAVKNWTGGNTLSGYNLFILFIVWFIARISMLFGTKFIIIAAICDLFFLFALIIAIMIPIIAIKQWKQAGVVSKLILLLIGNISFYFGVINSNTDAINWGVYGGLYLIIGLILTIGRRVIPTFIENGVDYPVKLFNSKLIDGSSLILFLAFFIIEVFIDNKVLIPYIATGLFIITSIRLLGWHTKGIWDKPLLWSLFIAISYINLGFLFFALSSFLDIPKMISVHSFTFGGVGMITISMMSRVSLGHSGRSIHKPPKLINYSFFCLILGSIFRILIPLFNMNFYPIWIIISQILWISAFTIFLIAYFPILIKVNK